MAKRFEKQQDPFVKRSEFYSLTIDVDDSIEEWADKVLEKGVKAFDQVPKPVREEELELVRLNESLSYAIYTLLTLTKHFMI